MSLTESEEQEYQYLFQKNKQYTLSIKEKNRLKYLKEKRRKNGT